MSDFVPFRNKDNGEIHYYPAHYADDPVLSQNIELYDPEADWYEEDKVVVDAAHELPVEQRAVIVATPLDEMDKEELVEAAEDRGLPTKGTKADLKERIAKDIKDSR